MQLKWLSIRYESKNKVLKFHHFWLQARTQIEKSGKKNFFFKLEIWQLRKIPTPQKKKHIFLVSFILSHLSEIIISLLINYQFIPVYYYYYYFPLCFFGLYFVS